MRKVVITIISMRDEIVVNLPQALEGVEIECMRAGGPPIIVKPPVFIVEEYPEP